LKGSLVGQSEQAIRTALAVIKSVAGRGGALWVATCNKLDVIPPELRRRFRLGTWFFDLPDADEKRAIWTLNEARYGLPTNPELRPEDANYTGSDIRNVCEIAWRLNCSLVDATRYLVPVATLDPDGLASLRKSANGRFLSVSHPGVYREGRTTTDTTRRIAV
jgi:SpoVK/Ycf46/Vps4 family AAA+-type ATPase